jgi:hypothetical protein
MTKHVDMVFQSFYEMEVIFTKVAETAADVVVEVAKDEKVVEAVVVPNQGAFNFLKDFIKDLRHVVSVYALGAGIVVGFTLYAA